MPLNAAALQNDLLSLFGNTGNFPATKEEAAARWAALYASYASQATSCQGQVPTSVAAAQSALATSLVGAFSGTDAASTASSIAAALTAFWTAPPMVFNSGGVVTVVAGTGVLTATLISNWVSGLANSISAQDAAAQHATAFDTFTKTVTVSHPLIPCAAPVF